MDEHDQSAVIVGLRRGEREAWAALYDHYSVVVWRYVSRMIGADQVEVADLVQETFLEAARSARGFDSSRGTLWSWLTGIAHNRVSLHWKQLKKSARLESLAEAHAGELRRWLDGIDDASGQPNFLEKTELAELVRDVLASLSPDYAALLMAKYIDDASLDDLSREWGQSVEALKSKLARARSEFREKAGRKLEVEA